MASVLERGSILYDGAALGIREWLRLPASTGHIRYLDGWRGLSIALVLLGHFVPAVSSFGAVGVELFFVLSGRLMAEILILKRQAIPTFIKRRIARIIPAATTFVLTIAVISNFSWWLAGRSLNWLSPFGALFFFHNYLSSSQTMPAFEHMWTLAVEEHSYLALALIAVGTRRKPLLAAAAATVVAGFAFANGWNLSQTGADDPLYLHRSDVRVASVLISFVVCIAVQLFLKPKVPKALTWLAPFGAIIGIACVYLYGSTNLVGLFCGSVAAAISVNTIDFSQRWIREILCSAVLVGAGTLSFSLYLWQQLFFINWRFEPWSILCVVPVMGIAVWSYKRIEKPARDFLNRSWKDTSSDNLPGGLAATSPVSA